MNKKFKKRFNQIVHLSAEYAGMSSTLSSIGNGKPATFISKR